MVLAKTHRMIHVHYNYNYNYNARAVQVNILHRYEKFIGKRGTMLYSNTGKAIVQKYREYIVQYEHIQPIKLTCNEQMPTITSLFLPEAVYKLLRGAF